MTFSGSAIALAGTGATVKGRYDRQSASLDGSCSYGPLQQAVGLGRLEAGQSPERRMWGTKTQLCMDMSRVQVGGFCAAEGKTVYLRMHRLGPATHQRAAPIGDSGHRHHQRFAVKARMYFAEKIQRPIQDQLAIHKQCTIRWLIKTCHLSMNSLLIHVSMTCVVQWAARQADAK